MRIFNEQLFKLAFDCPTKLFYINNGEYADESSNKGTHSSYTDSDLDLIQKAKVYYSEGQDLCRMNDDSALEETSRLLAKERVTIYGAAVKFMNILIRIDILQKKPGEHMPQYDIVEIKEKPFSGKYRYEIKSKGSWPDVFTHFTTPVSRERQNYLLEVVFKHAVLKLSLSHRESSFHVGNYLIWEIKSTKSADKLQQNGNADIKEFKCKSHTKFIVRELITEEIDRITDTDNGGHTGLFIIDGNAYELPDYIKYLASRYEQGSKIPPIVSESKCMNCQFKTTAENFENLKSGFDECHSECNTGRS